MSNTIVEVTNISNIVDVYATDTIVEVTDSETVVDAQVVEVIIELSGQPGPAGAPGNATIVQESEPISGMVEGDMWFNPVSNVMSVYHSGVWVLESQDDGYF